MASEFVVVAGELELELALEGLPSSSPNALKFKPSREVTPNPWRLLRRMCA
jgi:hypothetical protein